MMKVKRSYEENGTYDEEKYPDNSVQPHHIFYEGKNRCKVIMKEITEHSSMGKDMS